MSVEEPILQEMVKGEYLDYYRITTGETAYIKYRQSFNRAPGNVCSRPDPPRERVEG